MKQYAHSYSALSKFETCPRQYEARYILKHQEAPTEAQSWGLTVHSALEDAIEDGKPLPEVMQSYAWGIEPVQIAKAAGATILSEHKIAMTQAGEPVNFESDKAYARAIIDTAMLGDKLAVLLDYKSGAKRRVTDQLAFSAWIGFRQWPRIETIDTRFVFLKLPKHPDDRRQFRRSEIGALSSNILPRLHKLERAQASGVYPPTPSGLCRKHCSVTSCEFHGKGNR